MNGAGFIAEPLIWRNKIHLYANNLGGRVNQASGGAGRAPGRSVPVAAGASHKLKLNALVGDSASLIVANWIPLAGRDSIDRT
jgi:hypothetical protein